MKKILFTLVLFVSISCVYSQAQRSQHMTFKNIPIDGHIDNFVQKMRQEGFLLDFQGDNGAIMKGQFANRQCEVYIIASPKSKIVWKVVATTAEDTSWLSLKQDYLRFKEQYEQKYGKAESSYDFFAKPYYEGDGYEMQAVRNEKCHFISFWELRSGTISVGISSTENIKFTYEDKLNTRIAKRESNSKIQDDI